MLHAPPVVLPPAAPARRRAGRRAVALALVAPACAATTSPASADFTYTNACSVLVAGQGTNPAHYRYFRARLLTTRQTNGTTTISGYDYTYTVPPEGSWGPHSDEQVTITSGYASGANPWHSPDNHTTNVDWVAERGWKASTWSYQGNVKFHAYFDIPSTNDPECDAVTATF